MHSNNFNLMKDFAKAKEIYANQCNQPQLKKHDDDSSKKKDSSANKKTTTATAAATTTATTTDDRQPAAEQKNVAEEEAKHPLQHKYDLWLYKNDRTKSWDQNQILINSFKTVEDFWSLFNHIRSPSEIGFGNDYSLFKSGIRPMWEDPLNKKGGRWTVQLKKDDVDNSWLEAVLAMIGEAFENADDICGVVINVRKICKLSIWISNSNNEKAILEIGAKLKEVLNLKDCPVLQYQSHSQSMSASGANVKPMYSL